MENKDINQDQFTKRENSEPQKFCKHCGGKIPVDAVVCTLCGRQVEDFKQSSIQQPNVVINNSNNNSNINAGGMNGGRVKDKWVALLLCIFLGVFGGHKFYEGKVLLGIVYLFTAGLFGIGVFIDFVCLLFKPNPYYV